MKRTVSLTVSISLIFVIAMLSGCSASDSDAQSSITDETNTETTSSVEVAFSQATVLTSTQNIITPDEEYYFFISNSNDNNIDYETAKLEPASGCYLGADISNDKTVYSNIAEFEELTGKPHLLYANTVQLSDTYDYSWILECIKQERTPVLTIEPPNAYHPFQYDKLFKMAKQAGELNVPMFIQFYPYSSDKSYNEEEYLAYYEHAKDLFARYVSKAVFVWGVDSGDINDSSTYYPGGLNTDWVSLNIDISSAEDFDEEIIYNNIDYFYYTYQKEKPIMLYLSISHYSTVDMTYHTKEAAELLSNVYTKIAKDYPSIKAVVYKSYNELDDKKDGQKVFNNYLVTDEKLLTDAYISAISADSFLSQFDSSATAPTTQSFRSPFIAYKSESKYYISEKSLQYDLALLGLNQISDKAVIINNERYYETGILSQSLSAKITIDDKNKHIHW